MVEAAAEPRDGHTLVEFHEDPVFGGSFVNGKWEYSPSANGLFVGGQEASPETVEGDPFTDTGRLTLRPRCGRCRSRLIYDPERQMAWCSGTYVGRG